MRPLAGLSLTPNIETLELLAPLIRAAELFEMTPETLWAEREGRIEPNGFHRRFLTLAQESGRPFVAHGVGLSMGTASSKDAGRQRQWLTRMAEDHRLFRFDWYTEHLGASSLDGLSLQLPLPLPMTRAAASVVRRRLSAMQRVVPDVGVENNVGYFTFGDPLGEPAFIADILSRPRTHLLLDLHNLHTMALNLDFDPLAYLRGLDLGRVIEIHVSGGSWSVPQWLPSRRKVRLDGHDGAVPARVWRLLEWARPHCPALRAVVLERMEGTVRQRDVSGLLEELRRVRRICA